MLPAQLDGVDAHMQQQLHAAVGGHADGVFGVKHVVNGAVGGGKQLALGRFHRHAFAQRAGGKGLVLHLGHGHDGAGHGSAQHGVLLFVTGGGGRGRGRGGRGSLGGGADGGGRRGLHEVHQIGLDDRHLRSVNDLDAVALMHHAGGAGAFQHRVADLGGVDDRHAQTGGAAVHIGNVGLAAETLQNLGGNGVAHRRAGAVGADAGLGLEVGAGEQLGLLVVVLTAGGLEVALGDHEVEGEVVQEEVGDAHHDHPQPVGLGVALHDAEQRQVDQAAGEGHADAHVENVHEHVGKARVDAVYHIHGGGHEQEGELQRFGDAGEHGGQRRGDEQAAHHLTLFRLGGAVHGQRRAGQTEDHQRELAGHETGGFHREHLGALGGQLCEEDVLRALHGDAVHHGGAAHRGLPEGNVEHVMQAEGNEGAFRHAVDPGAHVAGTDDQIAQQRDGVLDHRPDVEHGDAHH